MTGDFAKSQCSLNLFASRINRGGLKASEMGMHEIRSKTRLRVLLVSRWLHEEPTSG
jgi:hypothetical protein